MRKNVSVFYILTAFLLSCGFLFGVVTLKKTYADDGAAYGFTEEIKSRSAITVEAESGKVIFAKNERELRPIASMCKIMTLLLCFESLDRGEFCLDDTVFVSDNASGMGGSQVFLESGTEYPVRDLLKSITVASANDACVAMAEKICGSEKGFVNKMNERASELEMQDTVFVNCTGLPQQGQHSSAIDVAKMFSELIMHKEYFEFSSIWMDEISHPKGRVTQISNTNKLVRFYNGCDSGKTGYTSEAKHCLCASAVRNGLRFISVVISSPDSKTRFKEVSSMFNYGFANYESKTVFEEGQQIGVDITVKRGSPKTVSVCAKSPVKVFSAKNEKKEYEINFVPTDNVAAPILKGDEVGIIKVFSEGVLIAEVPATVSDNVDVKSFYDSLREIALKWKLFG